MTDTPGTALEVVRDWRPSLAEAARTAAEQQMGSGPFNPGIPLSPYGGYSTAPRVYDYQSGYNIATRPRRNERVSFDTLRALIDSYDIASICIWHRINSIRSLSWAVVGKPGVHGPDLQAQIDLGTKILTMPDLMRPFSTWLATYLYDVLAFDAGTLYRIRNGFGRTIGLRVLDGTQFAPLLDYTGDTPEPPAPAFVQFNQGVAWEWLTTDDLIYLPYQPSSNGPYGKAPIESVLLSANTDLRFQAYFLQRFTAGNVPEAFAGSPEGWTPGQIEQYQRAWDAMLYGDDQAKHQVKWVPHGTTFAWTNEKEFTDAFSLFLMRKTAAAFHIVPSDLGFTEDVNRATSETQSDVQFRIGDLPLANHVEGILTRFLQDDLGLDCVFQFDVGQEKEDRLNTAQADEIYVNTGVLSISEVRERVFGLPEDDGVVVARFVNNPKLGPIALAQIAALAGTVDPESGGPELNAAGQPTTPVAPVGEIATEAKAEQAPVAKAETVGITADTGTYGSPLLSAPIDDVNADGSVDTKPEPLSGEDIDVAKAFAADLVKFRTFIKGRRRAGTWRPFTFSPGVDDKVARRLNQAGRILVVKAAGGLVAAGLAVVARDSGRVLMLQRAFDPTDPAAGMWEMPGGCIEDGESPLDAACREWQEETGLLLPASALIGADFTNGATWTSATGIYQGYVLLVDDEAAVSIGARGAVGNPDDPDGDVVEAIAWWDPNLLPGNPAVRAELGADIDIVLAALTGHVQVIAGDVVDVAKAGDVGPKASWRDGAAKAPQHAYDLRLTDYWAGRIPGALRALYPASVRRAAVERAANAVAKADDPHAIRAGAATAGVKASTGELEQLLRQMIADGYLAGLHTAAGQSGGYLTSELGSIAAGTDWDTWEPGDADAALAAADGGLADLLDEAGVTVNGISDTLLERLGNIIADGLAAGESIETVAGMLDDIIDDPSRAEMIAHTETARAVDAATMDTYTANGIGFYEVLLADGACPECEDVADGNPYPVDDGGQVPIHPWCRCASSPLYSPSSDGTPPPDDEGDIA